MVYGLAMFLVGFSACHRLLEKGSNCKIILRVLDKRQSKAKIPGNSRESIPRQICEGDASGFMSAKPFSQPPDANNRPCKPPRVQIVSREEDAEFVECLECREVFEASELKDMSIEENVERDGQES